ncbi:MAG: DEAD/DEAH box helicase, partial [Candidatus Alcyoniella australis]|nr:DEAD/DEAH box helicase [Candidatus Alcyoniella australis]
MATKLTVDEVLARLERGSLGANITAEREFEQSAGDFAPYPDWTHPKLREVLQQRGFQRLYEHQALAAELARQRKDVVIVTPTASGKTLCYNLPVLTAILEQPETRALYLFPTKALSQDQMHEVHSLIAAIGAPIKTFTYDGDTPDDARRAIRSQGHIVVSNPDMLHAGV